MKELIIKKEYYIDFAPLREWEVAIDIETTGFSKNATIVMIGIARYFSKEKTQIRQYIALDKDAEKEILICLLNDLIGYDTILTFNGDTFDIPRIKAKLEKYNINASLYNFFSKDIYRLLKSMNKYYKIPSLKQQDLEEFFKIPRIEDFDYEDMKNFYKTLKNDEIIEDEKIKIISRVLEHNYNDLINFLKLYNGVKIRLSSKHIAFKNHKTYLQKITLSKDIMNIEYAVEKFDNENLNSKTTITGHYIFQDGLELDIDDRKINLKILKKYDKKADIHYLQRKDGIYPLIQNDNIIYDNIYFLLDEKLKEI